MNIRGHFAPPFAHLIWLLLLTAACDTEEQELQINAVIDDAARALQSGDTKKIFSLTTEDLLVYPGKLRRGTATRKLHLAFRQWGATEIHHPQPEISFDSAAQAATVSIPFAMVRPGSLRGVAQTEDVDPQSWVKEMKSRAPVQRVELSMVKRNGDWRIQTIRLSK